MKIVLARIDDRFIHGQVLTRWIKIHAADRIIVVSDEVAQDEMRKNADPFCRTFKCESQRRFDLQNGQSVSQSAVRRYDGNAVIRKSGRHCFFNRSRCSDRNSQCRRDALRE